MRQIRIEKLTFNIGAGKDQKQLEKGMKLIEKIAGRPPVKTKTNKRVPSWGLRPGLPIGCKLTLRRDVEPLIKRLLEAKNNVLKPSCFDNEGNVSFGIHEYIDIPGVEYDPEIGIIGLQVSITLERPGFRIKKRKIAPRHIHRNHKISKEEAIEFMKEKFGIKVGDDDLQ